MIYQPRNVQPSGVSIDGLLDNTFTMEIQTNSYVSAYQLLIVDFDNNEIYTGSKTTLANYAYNGDILEIPVNASTVALSNGANYKWRVRLYQPTADMLITYGLVQATSTTTTIYLQPNINIKAGMAITINGQTKTISSYNSDTGVAVVSNAFSSAPAVGTQYKIYSDFIETVPDYIVYARQTPAVAISNVPSSLTLKYHTFQGTYTQSDNVPIVYHKFDLYTKNDDGTISLVASSDKVYSANLSYTYDSFRTGNEYLIQMTVENDMGIISTTDMYKFNVSYDIVEYLQQPLASFDDKNNAVKVSWVTPVENEATSFRSDAATGIIQDNNNTLTQATFEPGQSIGEGDVVQITNSDCELVIDGKSTQATRSGKNLFDISKVLNNGTKVVNNGDGTLSVNGYGSSGGSPSSLKTYCPSLKVGDKVILTFETTSSNKFIYLSGSNQKWNVGTERTITQSDLDSSVLWYRNEDSTTATISNIMIRLSSIIDDTYEPYGVMPSPDYPSPIESITEISATVTGKNLFNKYGDFTYGSTNNRTSLQSDGTILSTSNFGGSRSSGLLIGNIKSNTDYTISGILVSADGTSIANNAVIQVLTTSNTPIKDFYIKTSATKPCNFSFTFNSGENTSFWISLNGWNSTTEGTTNTIFDNIQLEEGTQITEYEEYKSNSLTINLQGNELCSLPNGTKDELVVENGRAKIIKRIGKVVLDGSESGWNVETISADHSNAYIYIGNAKGTISSKPFSQYFIYRENFTKYGEFRFGRINKNLIFADAVTEHGDLNGFKTWLSTHNTQVYYELAEPQIIELGDGVIPYIDGINYMHISSNMDTTFSLVYPHKTISGNAYGYTEFNPPGVKQTGTIKSYNAITGIGTLMPQYPFMYTPMQGDSYAVISNIYNVSGFSYLYNTPYNTVNSLYTHGYTATWATPDGLCVLPDDFNITLQFSPDGNFFYDQNGVYQEVVNLITTETDDANNEGEFTIKIDKNKLIFVQNPDISLELPFYTNTTQVFVLSSASVAQINNDYVWDDTATWTDTYTWVEGGTSLERVCNHWWKVQITNMGIKIEEIFPTT